MNAFVFLLLIGLAAAATVPDAAAPEVDAVAPEAVEPAISKTSIKIYGMKYEPIYAPYNPFVEESAKFYPPASREVNYAPVPYPYPMYFPYIRTRAAPAVARAESLGELSEEPVVVLLPTEDATLEAYLCTRGISCLSEMASAGNRALLFYPENLEARSLQELGVSDMVVKRLVLPEDTKLLTLARASYLLLTKEDAANYDWASFKNIGDIEVEGKIVRVLNAPYTDNPYKEALIKEIAFKKVDKIA